MTGSSMSEPMDAQHQAEYARRDEEHGPVVERLVCMKHGVVRESRQKPQAESVWHEEVASHLDGKCHEVVVLETVNA